MCINKVGEKSPAFSFMVNNMDNKNICYIECCGDRDHITRVWYDEDDGDFWVDMKVMRYPQIPRLGDRSLIYSSDDPAYLKLWKKIKFKYYRTKNYLTGIVWAVRGRPLWFEGNFTWFHGEAKQVSDFISKKTEQWEKKVAKAKAKNAKTRKDKGSK